MVCCCDSNALQRCKLVPLSVSIGSLDQALKAACHCALYSAAQCYASEVCASLPIPLSSSSPLTITALGNVRCVQQEAE